MNHSKRLVYGVGNKDAEYPVTTYKTDELGKKKRVTCRYYKAWHHMLERCYSEKFHERYPTYKDCSVCSEWLYFSKFKAWMEVQDFHGKELDKDLIIRGNKVYSPSTCVFIDKFINKFIGVEFNSKGAICHKKSNKYSPECRDPISGRSKYLGLFDTKEQAMSAWIARKREIAAKIAELQENKIISNALLRRYED